jgi:hypothetical protein
MTQKITKDLIDRIFKEPGIKYELSEFETLGKPIHEILTIYPKKAETGRDAGKTKYYLKSFIPFSSGNEEVQVCVEGGKSAPEEIIRQLWVHKLIHQYGYLIPVIKLMWSGHDHQEAFRLVAQKLDVRYNTVSSQCTRGLGLTTDDFIKRVESKTIVDLIEYKFPDRYQKIKSELKR